MSILAPAKFRLWIEQWKEEVMTNINSNDLKQKFEVKQIEKGRLPAKSPKQVGPKVEGGGQLL
jgi:hypothetical protein